MTASPLSELRNDSAEELLFALQRQHERAPGVQLVVDLSSLVRMERLAGALLANMLLGALGDARIKVILPSDAKLTWLSASGVAFAIANRQGETEVQGSLPPSADAWAGPWGAAAAEHRRDRGDDVLELFSPEELSETSLRPDLIGPTYAAFVEPHLAPLGAGSDTPVIDVVWPWLDALLAGQRDPARRPVRERFVAEVGRMLAETVGNVRWHAANGPRPLHSLLQLAVTRGGRGSSDRLHLVVQDNGPGIASTARPKVPPLLKASLLDHQLLFKLCDGSLPPWGRGRGMGLPTVREACRRNGGTLRIWTKTTRVVAAADADQPLTAGDGMVRVDGTVVAMTLPLPS